MNLKILRLTPQYDRIAVRGVLLVNGQPEMATLELPWKDNEPRVSCIPDGHYKLQRTINRSTAGGLKIPQTFEVVDVPDRAGILFHIGNTVKDTNGCILVGDSYGYIDEVPAVLGSRVAFNKLIQITNSFGRLELDILWQ